MSECEHPKACKDFYGDCLWCTEVAELRARNDGLKDCIGKQSFAVMQGVTLYVEGTIGLIEVYGGTVKTMQSGTLAGFVSGLET